VRGSRVSRAKAIGRDCNKQLRAAGTSFMNERRYVASSAGRRGRMSIKICPSCGQRRPATEVFCANDGWDLTTVAIAIEGVETFPQESPAPKNVEVRCCNGHRVRAGDFFCPVCEVEIDATGLATAAPAATGFGEDPQSTYEAGPLKGDEPATPTPETASVPTIGAWSLLRRISQEGRATQTWAVRRHDGTGSSDAILVLHPEGSRIEAAVASAVAGLAPRFAISMDSGGQHGERPFEVIALNGMCPLSEIIAQGLVSDQLRELIALMAGILADLGRLGVRHRRRLSGSNPGQS